MKEYTVADYLLDRLKELGITDVLGVPGDYSLQFLDKITERDDMRWVGNANELNAAYMADGYAREKGAAVFITTFGVGELSAINGLAGSYAENVPVLEIACSPKKIVQDAGKLVHHTFGDGKFDRFEKMHEQVTSARTHLTEENAREEIDRVLIDLIKHRKPVYMNMPLDVALLESTQPQKKLDVEKNISDESKEIFKIISDKLQSAKQPVVMVGHELASFNFNDDIQKFLNKTKLPTTSLSLGKGIVDESRYEFIGTYCGSLTEEKVKNFVDSSDFLLLLGVKLTDSVTSAFSHAFKEENVIALNNDSINIFGEVSAWDDFSNLREGLELIDYDGYSGLYVDKTELEEFTPQKEVISQDRLWQAVSNFYEEGDTLIAEQGTSFFGVANLPLKKDMKFIGQPLWGSIGYTFPSTLGSQLANPDSRHLLFIGDGSLQMTAQELGVGIREGLTPIIFVLNNDGYTVEREIHGPEEVYNDIPRWDYVSLPKAFGANDDKVVSIKVETEKELDEAMKKARADKNRMYWIDIVMDRLDSPKFLEDMAKLYASQNAK